MIVGFTGPQNGMTEVQRPKVFKWLMTNASRIEEAHHGDCVGADEDFHNMCIKLLVPRIIIHPPEDDSKRAYCGPVKGAKTQVVVLPTKPYLERNDDITATSNMLIATPAQALEVQRSGTWATIRYMKKRKKHVVAFHPETGLLMRVGK